MEGQQTEYDVDRCTTDAFLAEAEEWHNDAQSNRDSITWLYLVGHCLELSSDQIFLFEDFGGGPGASLRKTASIGNIVSGMAPAPHARHIARSQYYFVDVTRVRIGETDQLQWQSATPVFDNAAPTLDDRETAVYYAGSSEPITAPGGTQLTPFSDLLLQCLEGAAAESVNGSWRVTSVSLAKGLHNPWTTVSGSLRAGTICYLREAPRVAFEVRFETSGEATQDLRLEIRTETDEVLEVAEPQNGVYRTVLRAGIYSATVTTGDRPIARMLVVLTPPSQEITIRLPTAKPRAQ